MKLLHFADLHLGSESYGIIDPETGLSSRLRDCLSALDQVIDCAIREDVDIVIFCGDAYQKRDPSQTHQREFAKRLKRLSSHNIPVVLIIGNHDLPNAANRANSVEIFPTLEVKNVLVASRPEIIPVTTKSGPIQVACLPWARRSAILSTSETKGLTSERITEEMQTRLTAVIANLAERVNTDAPCVFAAHVSIQGAIPGTETGMNIGKDPTILLSNIALPQFDYVALGHIHGRQVLCTDPPVCYSGSLIRLDFKDENQDKGFYLVELDSRAEPRSRRRGVPQFVKINTRPFVTVKVNIAPEDSNPMPTVLATIDRRLADIQDAIVKIEINIPKTLSKFLNDKSIRDACRKAHNVILSHRYISDIRSPLDVSNPEQLTPIQALSAYLEQRPGVTPERRKLLLSYAEKLANEILHSY